MTETATPHLTTYCAECDQPDTVDCGHTGRRYLDPIEYEPVVDHNGRRVGWHVPDHERARWDNPVRPPDTRPRDDNARPVAGLVAELDKWCLLEPTLEERLRAAYIDNPARVTRLVDVVAEKAKAGELRNPAGFLASKLPKPGLRLGE